jgi:hypothetical protein
LTGIKLADINENSWAKTSVGFGTFGYPALGGWVSPVSPHLNMFIVVTKGLAFYARTIDLV